MTALLRAISGLIGWALAFSLIYGLQGLVCSPQLARVMTALPLGGRELLIAAWLLCLTLLASLAWVLWHRATRETLLDWLAPTLALTGLAATTFTGFPVVFATTCS
jgi:hypothetical protein